MNVAIGLILVNAACFLLLQRVLPWWELALSAPGLRSFKLWQLLTYMFVHGGVWHLLLNMWGLYLFGQPVLSRLGPKRFLTLYAVSGLSGAVLWLVFNWNSRFPVIGASGAVFGVMMAAALLFPNMRIMLLFPPIPMKVKTFVAIYALIEIVSELSNVQGGVAHLAHLGGFLGSYVYLRLLSGEGLKEILTRSPFRKRFSVSQKQSEVNRATFERIMAEIEETERRENEQKGHE